MKNFWLKFKKWIIACLLGSVCLAGGLALPDNVPTNETIIDKLKDKTVLQKAQIKSNEIAKIKIDKFKKDDLEIEIIGDIKAIEINGQNGIEYFAKAWKNGKQLGFSKDGSVEIERFRVFNPPILVDDENGDIIREWIDEKTGELKQRKLKEDPQEAVKQSLAHTIKLVGKENTKIIKGKIGNTTSTFYPAAGSNSPVDGYVRYRQNSATPSWALVRDSSSGTDAYDNAGEPYGMQQGTRWNPDSPYLIIYRCFVLFNTASIPDTDEVSSAVYSAYFYDVSYTNADDDALNYSALVASTPASTNTLVLADYSQIGTALMSDTKYLGSTVGSQAYKDFQLNSAGISNISLTAVSKFGMRIGHDIEDESAGFISGVAKHRNWNYYSADETGTTQDPKLVVEHSEEAEAGAVRKKANQPQFYLY